jgi:hypothetical protein
MPKVMANRLYRQTLTLRVRMTARIMRERERVKERASSVTKTVGATTLR